MNLQTYLNQLWASVIEKIDFDILKHTITLKIKTIDHGIEKEFVIVFSEVAAYFFIENRGDKRLISTDYDEGDYLELTSIEYFKDGIGNIMIEATSNDWLEQYYSSANFALEIWSSMLLIEANTFTVNGKVFEVGYHKTK